MRTEPIATTRLYHFHIAVTSYYNQTYSYKPIRDITVSITECTDTVRLCAEDSARIQRNPTV